MYPASPVPKRTQAGLPVRNIDYGTLHKSLRVLDRDVKRNLEPNFLENLGKMCLNSSGTGGEVHGGKSGVSRDNAISCRDNAISDRDKGGRDMKEREHSPLLNAPTAGIPHTNCSASYCGICRKKEEEMTHYGIYHQDDSVDLVMGGVIDRIDHLIDRLGKGGYDKKACGNNHLKNDTVGIVLPCEACAIRSQKRYSHASSQTEEPAVEDLDVDTEAGDLPSIDEAVLASPAVSPSPASPTEKIHKSPGAQRVKKSSSSTSVKTSSGIYTDVDDDNLSTLSSDDEEFSLEMDNADDENQIPVEDQKQKMLDLVPSEVREYEIASSLRREMPEVGSTETVHFRMLPYKNLYVWGHRKFVGTLPSRVALKSNYDLNYHITVFKTLTSDRPEIRMKRLKELVTSCRSNTSSPTRRGVPGRTLDSSNLGNILVVDIPRYSRQAKRRVASDIRIPVVNLRDGHCNKLWLSERVSGILLSRSPRLRFAVEIAKSNRAHWKLAAKDLVSNQRPYQYISLYGGKSYTQFYLSEMKRFVCKPLQSRCLVYYADLYEDNTKDHVKSKTYVSCLGNITSRDSRSTPIVQWEDRIKEHIRAGQKLYDPKVNIFNVALQNPALALDEPGRFLPQKGSSEITKCPNLLFVPLDFGFSSWSKPSTQNHLSALRQAYCDVFCSNGPAGYNI